MVLFYPPLRGLEVGQHQLRRDDLDVADRVEETHRVGDVVFLEATHNVDDCVDFADVGEELVAEAFALVGALDQAGNVDELDRGGDDRAGLEEQFEAGQTIIGDGDNADVGLDGAERIIGDRRLVGAGDCVEEGGLACVGQSDDAGFQHRREGLTPRVHPRSNGICRRNRRFALNMRPKSSFFEEPNRMAII